MLVKVGRVFVEPSNIEKIDLSGVIDYVSRNTVRIYSENDGNQCLTGNEIVATINAALWAPRDYVVRQQQELIAAKDQQNVALQVELVAVKAQLQKVSDEHALQLAELRASDPIIPAVRKRGLFRK